MVADYLEDDEHRASQLFLAAEPEAGDVMRGTCAFLKLRCPNRRRGKGKRGCLRLICTMTFRRDGQYSADENVYLIKGYDERRWRKRL